MALTRHAVEAFQIANNAYIGAEVTFYVAGPGGVATATKATLYADVTGASVLSNPQTLNSNGAQQQPIYIDVDVVASISAGAASGQTGVIRYGGSVLDYVAGGTHYYTGDAIIGPAGNVPDVEGNIYESNDIFDSTNWAADVAANLTLLVDYQAILAAALATVVPYATIAETRAGTVTNKVVSPDDLASLWQKGADIAAASTLVQPGDNVRGGYHAVTGAAITINLMWTGEADGTSLRLRYDAAHTLVHSVVAGGMRLPGGANITIDAGTVIEWIYESATSTWRFANGTKADGSSFVTPTVTSAGGDLFLWSAFI